MASNEEIKKEQVKLLVGEDDGEAADTIAPLGVSNPRKMGAKSNNLKMRGGRVSVISGPGRASMMRGFGNRMSLLSGAMSSATGGLLGSSMQVSGKARASVALFASKQSIMIKPGKKLMEETKQRTSIISGDDFGGDLKRMETKFAQAAMRTSIFSRMDQKSLRRAAYGDSLCGGACLLDLWYAFYDYWEYYTVMTFLYIFTCFTVFNPLSKEVADNPFRYPGAGVGLDFELAVLLLIAKWTAAPLYILFFELIFIYSRVGLGFFQMTPLGQYVPYMHGDYHNAHKLRGWAFIICATIHIVMHMLRVILKQKMPLNLWISGGTLTLSLTILVIVALRAWDLPCVKQRWGRAWIRQKLTWEMMRITHIFGVLTMGVSAWWHRFYKEDEPLRVWFPSRFFILFMCANGFYMLVRLIKWMYTVQIDVVTHTIYNSCQLVVIPKFPYAREFCTHGRAWFSADAKVMHPDVNNRQWHPFTCVVNAKTAMGFILIKNYGDWSSAFTQVPASFLYMRTPPLKMSFEIPPKYRNVLVVASGTFITTVAGTVAQALSLTENDGASQNITICWIDREPIMIALVCLRLLAEFTSTTFKIYCTAKDLSIDSHLNEVQIMSTMAHTMAEDDDQKIQDHDFGNLNIDKEADINEALANSLFETTNDDKENDDIIAVLKNVVKDMDHIEICVGRPPVDELFIDLLPDFVFIGAAPPVTNGIVKLAEEKGVDYKTSAYL